MCFCVENIKKCGNYVDKYLYKFKFRLKIYILLLILCNFVDKNSATMGLTGIFVLWNCVDMWKLC